MQPVTIENDIETFEQGIQREYRHERRLVIIRVPSPTRQTVDEWVSVHADTVTHWPEGEPIYLLLDLSHSAFTPYVAQRAKEANDAYPLHGTMALVLEKSVVGVMFQQLSRLLMRKQGDLALEYFTDVGKAMQWLEAQLKG